MEKHTVEVTFEAEKVSELSDEHGILTLYRTPEDAYFVHIDTRHVSEEAARVGGRKAELEVGCFPKGHTEDMIRAWWPDLLAPESAK